MIQGVTYLNLWETKMILEKTYRISYYLNSNVNIPLQNLRKKESKHTNKKQNKVEKN